MATFNSKRQARGKMRNLPPRFFIFAAGIFFADSANAGQKSFRRARRSGISPRANPIPVGHEQSDQRLAVCPRVFRFRRFRHERRRTRRALPARASPPAGSSSRANRNPRRRIIIWRMNLGQLARTELLGALKLVKEMEREFKTAADLDKQFDYAGPERCLGLLYRDAPGWPASIGSRRKARDCSGTGRKTRAGLSRKSPEPRRILFAMARKRRREKRTGRARRALAGGADKFHRRSLGTKLGRLVHAPRRRAQKTGGNFRARQNRRKTDGEHFSTN